MKCVLSDEFKELCSSAVYVILLVTMLATGFISLATTIGYVSLHWFDLVLIIKNINSPIEYYLMQGTILIIAAIIISILLKMLYSLILYPLYFLIFKFKKVLNYIFDCKGN